MFGKKDKPFNPHIYRMTEYMNFAIEGRYATRGTCAEEIVPMIKALYEKSINAKVKWDGAIVCWHIEKIVKMLQYLAYNTRNYEKLSDEDVVSLKKIFDELDVLHAEAIFRDSQSRYEDNLTPKIDCISEILCQNMADMYDSKEDHHDWRDGMMFQNYEDLWKIIHRINTEWEELCTRGFSMNVFDDYRKSFQYDRENGMEMSEEMKLKTFMALLDGKMKFVPVYRHECRLLGLKVVNNDAEDEIIYTSEDISRKNAYRMRQKGEENTQCEAMEN